MQHANPQYGFFKGSARNAFDQAELPLHGSPDTPQASKNPRDRDARLLQPKFCVFTRPRLIASIPVRRFNPALNGPQIEIQASAK